VEVSIKRLQRAQAKVDRQMAVVNNILDENKRMQMNRQAEQESLISATLLALEFSENQNHKTHPPRVHVCNMHAHEAHAW
jgi:hypothetical protein